MKIYGVWLGGHEDVEWLGYFTSKARAEAVLAERNPKTGQRMQYSDRVQSWGVEEIDVVEGD